MAKLCASPWDGLTLIDSHSGHHQRKPNQDTALSDGPFIARYLSDGCHLIVSYVYTVPEHRWTGLTTDKHGPSLAAIAFPLAEPIYFSRCGPQVVVMSRSWSTNKALQWGWRGQRVLNHQKRSHLLQLINDARRPANWTEASKDHWYPPITEFSNWLIDLTDTPHTPSNIPGEQRTRPT